MICGVRKSRNDVMSPGSAQLYMTSRVDPSTYLLKNNILIFDNSNQWKIIEMKSGTCSSSNLWDVHEPTQHYITRFGIHEAPGHVLASAKGRNSGLRSTPKLEKANLYMY